MKQIAAQLVHQPDLGRGDLLEQAQVLHAVGEDQALNQLIFTRGPDRHLEFLECTTCGWNAQRVRAQDRPRTGLERRPDRGVFGLVGDEVGHIMLAPTGERKKIGVRPRIKLGDLFGHLIGGPFEGITNPRVIIRNRVVDVRHTISMSACCNF